MHVIDLEGNEYALQATSTIEAELNGNQSLSATILPTKVNKAFIDDITEMWAITDHDNVEQRIIHVVRRGKGDGMSVDIKAIPLFFDVMDTLRIYERYDEHMTAQLAFNRIFEDTGFNFVLGGSFAAVDWEGFGDGETRLETFKRALERYKCEFRIVGNIVYLEHRIGNDTSHQYRHKLNASNIVQEVDANEMWTYAKGYGDYGDGEGGEDWQNAKLKREYTSPLAKIIGIRHAPPIKNGNITTISQMDAQLKTLVDESLKISITADIHDLTRQNYPIAQSQLGDRVFIIDERIGLDEEVRIVNKSITRNWRGDILDVNLTFGSEGLAKRHQSKLSTAIKDITSLLEGKIQLPYSVLDDAVKNATKALKDAQTQLVFSENGILAIDKNNPNLVTLFNSAGIGVSSDGGATFGQALTGQGLNVDYVYTGTMLADYIAGGILAALNGNTVFNLNDGHLEMKSTQFTLGGGARIDFTSSGNTLRYTRNNRHAGLMFATSINDTYPVVGMGVTNINQPLSITDDAGFSGFIANANARETADGVQNSVIGKRFHVRDKAVSFSRGFSFSTTSDAYLTPMNTGSHDYDLGRSINRWQTVYLYNNPNVSSDKRSKTDINDIDLEFAKKFLGISAKRYKKKLTNANLNTKIRGSNPYEFGFIAQEVESIFDGNDMRFESLVSTANDGSKSMQYGQIPAIHHVLIQDIYNRLELLENATG